MGGSLLNDFQLAFFAFPNFSEKLRWDIPTPLFCLDAQRFTVNADNDAANHAFFTAELNYITYPEFF